MLDATGSSLGPRRINWINVSTVLSAAILISAEVFGANRIGLERQGFQPDSIEPLQNAFRLLTRSGLNTTQALERIAAEVEPCDEVNQLIEFIRASGVEHHFISSDTGQAGSEFHPDRLALLAKALRAKGFTVRRYQDAPVL